jgi:hypothetical protein
MALAMRGRYSWRHKLIRLLGGAEKMSLRAASCAALPVGTVKKLFLMQDPLRACLMRIATWHDNARIT